MTFIKTEQFASFIKLAGDISATRVLELGTNDSAYLSEFIRQADWSDAISLHCDDTGSETIDSELKAAASNDPVEFNVGHVGSETEVNDVFSGLEEELFDMAWFRCLVSAFALLHAWVCNETVRTGGTVVIAEAIMVGLHRSGSSFSDMFADLSMSISLDLHKKINCRRLCRVFWVLVGVITQSMTAVGADVQRSIEPGITSVLKEMSNIKAVADATASETNFFRGSKTWAMRKVGLCNTA